MGKKKGKKATEDEVTKENEGQEKPASPPTRTGVPTKQTQKRTANDIDGIFGTVKKSKTPRVSWQQQMPADAFLTYHCARGICTAACDEAPYSACWGKGPLV